MVFSPDADVMLGTAATTHESDSSSDEELIGAPAEDGGSDEVINEDLGSLHDLLSQVERREDDGE